MIRFHFFLLKFVCQLKELCSIRATQNNLESYFSLILANHHNGTKVTFHCVIQSVICADSEPPWCYQQMATLALSRSSVNFFAAN